MAESLEEDGLLGADGLLEEDELPGEDEQVLDRMTWPTGALVIVFCLTLLVGAMACNVGAED